MPYDFRNGPEKYRKRVATSELPSDPDEYRQPWEKPQGSDENTPQRCEKKTAAKKRRR